MTTRRERVVLELEDRFSRGIAEAAVHTKAFERALRDLNGTTARTKVEVTNVEKPLAGVGNSARTTDRSINQLTGRLRLLTDVALTLGPALVPIGGAAIPGLVAMTTQLGLVAGAGGVAVAALVGIGDGLEALNKAQLEPTEDNLAALRLEMEKLGPAGAAFVNYLDSIAPQLKALQFTAREGFLPGLQEGIDSLLDLGPQVNGIIAEIAVTMGDLAARSGAALSGDSFAAFFDFLDNRAAPLLMEFGQTIGNVAEGMANLLVGFSPLTDQFSRGLLGMTESFAAWSRGLAGDQGFQSFIDYLRETGPQVVDLLGSMAQAIGSFVQAAAPIGQALLPVLTAIAEAFAAIAASPIGTPLLTAAAGLAAFNRAATLATAAMARMNAAATTAGASMAGLGVGAAALGGAMAADLLDSFDDVQFSAEQMDSTLRQLADGQIAEGLNGLSFGADSLREALTQAAWNDLHFADAADEIETLDAAMADLAGRDLESAERAFATIEAEAKAAGISTEELAGIFPQYTDAAYRAGKASDALADATNGSATAQQREAQATEAARQAMLAKADATLAAFDAETAWRQALVAARSAQNRNTAGIRGNSEAALSNRNILSDLASAWNNQSDAVRSNAARQRAARAAFIAVAEGMGVSTRAARDLANEVLAIPTKREVRVTADTSQASTAISGVYADLLRIPKSVTTYVNTVRTGPAPGFEGFARKAEGGTVPRTGLPYADRHPYLLADGEEVISNRYGQADRHRALLKAINAGRLAEGGTAGGNRPAFRSGGVRDLDDEARGTARGLRGLKRELARSEKALSKEVAHRQDLIQERNQYHGEVAGTFRHDLFGNGAAGMRLQLEADRNDARAMTQSIQALKRKGVSDALLREVAASGDLNTADQLAAMRRGGINQFDSLYRQRQQVTANLGNIAAAPLYAQPIREDDTQIQRWERTVDRLEKRLRVLDKSVEEGARKGVGERSRKTAQRVRTGGRG